MILLNLEKRDTPKQTQLDQNSKDESLNQPDSVSPDIQTYDSRARHNTEHQIGHKFDVLIGDHFWRLIEKSAYLPGDTNQMPGAECDVSSAFFRWQISITGKQKPGVLRPLLSSSIKSPYVKFFMWQLRLALHDIVQGWPNFGWRYGRCVWPRAKIWFLLRHTSNGAPQCVQERALLLSPGCWLPRHHD